MAVPKDTKKILAIADSFGAAGPWWLAGVRARVGICSIYIRLVLSVEQ